MPEQSLPQGIGASTDVSAKTSPPVLPEELFQEANLGNLKSSYFLQGISGTQWTGLIIFAGLAFILLLCL